MRLIAVVLTLNEERHLPRCLDSLKGLVDEVLVVDSFSTDDTVNIAEKMGARVLQHAFVNQAAQFNWALTQINSDIEWVLRIDADEYLTPELSEEIRVYLPTAGVDVDGIYFGRRIAFQGRLIRYGGVFPVRVLRLFRNGRGKCENRWMDEHIKVSGLTVSIKGEIIDDNCKSLTWWTDKHNRYASREVVDLLNLEYGFMSRDSVASLTGGSQAGVKRWLKEVVYIRLPGGVRAFAYFVYRYVIRLGFLDGRAGTAFHFLQGFWYRYLVDAKLVEVHRYMEENSCSLEDSIKQVLEIDISSFKVCSRSN